MRSDPPPNTYSPARHERDLDERLDATLEIIERTGQLLARMDAVLKECERLFGRRLPP